MRQTKLQQRREGTDPEFKGIFHPDILPASVGLFGFIVAFSLFSLQLAFLPFTKTTLQQPEVLVQETGTEDLWVDDFEYESSYSEGTIDDDFEYIGEGEFETDTHDYNSLEPSPEEEAYEPVLGAAIAAPKKTGLAGFWESIKSSFVETFSFLPFVKKTETPEVFLSYDATHCGDCAPGDTEVCQTNYTMDTGEVITLNGLKTCNDSGQTCDTEERPPDPPRVVPKGVWGSCVTNSPPPSRTCTPGEYDRSCTGACGGCPTNAGEAKVKQCKADGSGWEDTGSECRTDCVGPCSDNPPPPSGDPQPSGTPTPSGGGGGGGGGLTCTKPNAPAPKQYAYNPTTKTAIFEINRRTDMQCTDAVKKYQLTYKLNGGANVNSPWVVEPASGNVFITMTNVEPGLIDWQAKLGYATSASADPDTSNTTMISTWSGIASACTKPFAPAPITFANATAGTVEFPVQNRKQVCGDKHQSYQMQYRTVNGTTKGSWVQSSWVQEPSDGPVKLTVSNVPAGTIEWQARTGYSTSDTNQISVWSGLLTSTINPAQQQATCGNGVLDAGEVCDPEKKPGITGKEGEGYSSACMGGTDGYHGYPNTGVSLLCKDDCSGYRHALAGRGCWSECTSDPAQTIILWGGGDKYQGDTCADTTKVLNDQCQCVTPSGGSFSCTGTIPTNATMCADDDQGLTADTARTLVAACTAATKCEFTCNTGYSLQGTSCVRNQTTAGPTCSLTAPASKNITVGRGGQVAFSCKDNGSKATFANFRVVGTDADGDASDKGVIHFTRWGLGEMSPNGVAFAGITKDGYIWTWTENINLGKGKYVIQCQTCIDKNTCTSWGLAQ